MGVPCVTLRGGCHAHNVGVSLLTAVGLRGFIVENEVRSPLNALQCYANAAMLRRSAPGPACTAPRPWELVLAKCRHGPIRAVAGDEADSSALPPISGPAETPSSQLRTSTCPLQDQYVRKAKELAADLPALAALRQGLRERVLASELCDGAGLARAVENAYG